MVDQTSTVDAIEVTSGAGVVGTVTGRITPPSGGDATDAIVRLVRPDGTTYDTTTPESDGSYTFENVVPNTYTVQVIYPGSEVTSPPDSVTVTADASATIDPVTVPEPTASTGTTPAEVGNLSGDIAVTNGRDPRDATVTLLSGTSVVQVTNPDSSGSYSFNDIATGDYQIEISYRDTSTITINVRVRSGRTTAIPDQTVNAPPVPRAGRGNVAGQVTYEGGDITQVGITLSDGSNSSTTRPDADGNYNFTNLTVGRYEIVAEHDLANSVSTRVLVEANRTVMAADLDLSLLPATLSGRVVLMGTGDEEDVDVILVKDGSDVESIHPGSDGLYVFSDVEPGTYQLRFHLANFGDAYQNGIVLMANQALRLADVEMAANPGTAEGRVMIDGVGSLGDVEVRLRQSNTELRRVTPNTATGAYRFSNLKPGTYMVAVYYNDVVTAASDDFSITSDTVTTVDDLSFSTNGSIQGTVTLVGGGRDVRKAKVKLQRGGMTIESTKPDSDGNYAFSEVQPGTYDVIVELSRYIPAEERLLVDMGVSHTLDIDLTFGEDDHGSELGDTTRLVLPARSKDFEPMDGDIEVPDDEDWFALSMRPRFSYLVSIEGDTLPDPALVVYASDGETVVTQQNNRSIDNRDPRLLITAPASVRRRVVYYLAVKAIPSDDGSNIGSYTVNVKEVTNLLRVNPTTNQGSDRNSIDFLRDVKLYYTELQAGQTYVIHAEGLFNGEGTLPDPKLDLYNGDYTTRIDGNNDAVQSYWWGRNRNSRLVYRVPGTTGTVDYQLAVTGHYDSRLYSGTGDGTGTFRIRIVLQDPSIWSGDDYASNTSTTGLVTLSEGRGMAEGTIQRAGDRDWFKVVLTGGESYSIDVRAKNIDAIDGLGDPGVILYNASGTFVGRDEDGGSNWLDASLSYTVSGTGQKTFYIGVYGEYSSRGAYAVFVSNVEADVGDTASTAEEKTLLEGDNGLWGREWRGTINYAGDRDWYKVTLRPDQSYRIHLRGAATHDGTLRDPYIRLFDARSNLILAEDDGGIRLNALTFHTTDETAEVIYVEAGEYRQNNAGTYLMVVHETGDIPSENNYQYAKELPSRGGVIGKRDRLHYTGDVDWFKVELMPTSTYRFYFWPSTLNEDDPSIPLDIGFVTIFDQDGSTALSAENLISVIDKAALFYRTVPGDATDPAVTHYIRLRSRIPFSNLDVAYIGRYFIRVDQVLGLDDYGSSTSAAGVLNLRGVPASGAIDGDLESRNDKDWFSVDLRNGERYTIQLFGDPVFPGASLRSPILVLRDSTGTEVERSTTGAVAREIVFRVPGIFGSSTYYIEAGGENSATRGVGIYKLTVEEHP